MISAPYMRASIRRRVVAGNGIVRGTAELVRAHSAAARGILLAVAVTLLAAGLTIVAVRGEAYATLPLSVNVRGTADPQQIGATTSAQVELYNHGERDISPRFSVSWLPYPYYWRIVSGPPILSRGERATYDVAAPDTVAAPHDGDTFRIKVNDANGITYALSSPIEIAKRQLAVVNPELKAWTQRDPSTGLLSPAGWQTYRRRGAGDVALVENISLFGVAAAHFRVVQDGQPDPGGWAHAGLVQEIAFPDGPFDVRVLGQTHYQANDAGWPLAAFGLEVSDTSNGMAWLLFMQTGNGDREYDLPTGHHIVVYDVPDYQWTTRTIDLPALYHRLNWPTPKNVRLNLFAAAASGQAGQVEGYVSGIAAPTSARQQATPSSLSPQTEGNSR